MPSFWFHSILENKASLDYPAATKAVTKLATEILEYPPE